MTLRKTISGLLAVLGLMTGSVEAVRAQAGADIESPAADLAAGAWMLYQHKFLTQEGRIIDNKAGDISHSEGQGYGMLMAVLANDRRAFDLIWNWTRANLVVRDDGLMAWRWDGSKNPHVKDKNNATDGDLLVAWALLRASQKWKQPEYGKVAAQMAQTISKRATAETAFGKVLMPGIYGFNAGEQPDGPVVNLSYWVFPALSELAQASKGFPGKTLVKSGLSLLREGRVGPAKLPPDWIGLAASEPKPAQGFPAQFGYEAIRIPLYLAWYSPDYPDLLETFSKQWKRSAGTKGLAVIELTTATATSPMPDPGYRAVAHLVECSLGRSVNIEEISNFKPTDYYPSTLHVLSLMAIAERYPTCLTGSL
ncbi:glycosyl hydrolase family 8 [Neorhizobium alkalisoli]|uniref:cellulase n=1 Tax=Neorhizobium alkalisoli TaxID=528178 RepID=A0A561R8T2_9HYPH|nr:glycosyl hydrolase family 8 [Neorhizobium alkalisoli]TWF59021.1 endoglucanase [Neorhizobium alkalisoli]